MSHLDSKNYPFVVQIGYEKKANEECEDTDGDRNLSTSDGSDNSSREREHDHFREAHE